MFFDSIINAIKKPFSDEETESRKQRLIASGKGYLFEPAKPSAFEEFFKGVNTTKQTTFSEAFSPKQSEPLVKTGSSLDEVMKSSKEAGDFLSSSMNEFTTFILAVVILVRELQAAFGR